MSMKNKIKNVLDVNHPLIIWGEPGVGKTSCIQAIAQEEDYFLQTLVASLHPPTDFSGLPKPNKETGGVDFLPMNWVLICQEKAEEGVTPVVFFDELSRASSATQDALLRIIFERIVGQHELPEETRFVAASNPPEQVSSSWDLDPALANRFSHLDWDLNVNEWVQGMVSGWSQEDELSPSFREARSFVASFIQSRRELLLDFPESDHEAGRSWPSPRSWMRVAEKIAAHGNPKTIGDQLKDLIVSDVGSGPAMEFLEYTQDIDLPEPEEVLQDPSGFELPEREDLLYALLSSVASYTIDSGEESVFQDAWDFVYRIADVENKPDVAFMTAKTLAKNAPEEDGSPLMLDGMGVFLPRLKEAGILGDN